MTDAIAHSLTPVRLAAIGGIFWNAFGVFQFYMSTFSTVDSMISLGMTRAQAELYAALPLGMPFVFAVGTIGGLAGSLLLLARNRLAVPVFAVSLAGYVALFIGDWLLGVFAAFGARQVITLCFVVAIAAALLWNSRRWAARGLFN